MAITLELAEYQPVLFILDDAHWTDPTTLEFIDLLIAQTPTTQLLILIIYRPEFQSTWGNRSYLTPITLNRLSRDGIEQMAIKVAEGKTLPNGVLQHLAEKTDGVPLYVEEMTKAVLESGALKEMNGHYDLTGSISTLAIPATLQDSLMARLDRLVTAKGVAQQAAVIGRQFSYALLQAVSQLDHTVLERELGILVDAELIYQRGLSPQATYLFKHALVQDTAYQSLLRSTRQGYHGRIAVVLAERFPETTETQPELLAHHYTEAGLAEQAITYWQRAGEQARTRSANVESIAYLNKGLEVLTTLPETHERVQRELNLQMSLALAYHATKGQHAIEVRRAYLRAQELCEHVSDDYLLFRVLMGLWRSSRTEDKLREYEHELFRVAERTRDSRLLLEAHMALGATMLHDGAFSKSRNHLEQALALYDSQDHDYYAAHSILDPGVNSLSRLS